MVREGVKLYNIVIVVFRVHQTNMLKKDWENGTTLLLITREHLSVNIRVKIKSLLTLSGWISLVLPVMIRVDLTNVNFIRQKLNVEKTKIRGNE